MKTFLKVILPRIFFASSIVSSTTPASVCRTMKHYLNSFTTNDLRIYTKDFPLNSHLTSEINSVRVVVKFYFTLHHHRQYYESKQSLISQNDIR